MLDLDTLKSADFPSRTHIWEEWFDSRVVLRNYDMVHSGGRDITTDFCALLGLDPDAMVMEPAVPERKLSHMLCNGIRAALLSGLPESALREVFDAVFAFDAFLTGAGVRDLPPTSDVPKDVLQLIDSLAVRPINTFRTIAEFRSEPVVEVGDLALSAVA
jgi:hypothetical protein